MKQTSMVGCLGLAVALSGCAGFGLQSGEDAARRACIERARDRGLEVLEADRVEPVGSDQYQVSLRIAGLLGTTYHRTCDYNRRTGADLR